MLAAESYSENRYYTYVSYILVWDRKLGTYIIGFDMFLFIYMHDLLLSLFVFCLFVLSKVDSN